MASRGLWQVWFRSRDLDAPTVLIGEYPAQTAADKIAMVIQTCSTTGECFTTRLDLDERVEPS
jgi:hypothetical protein